VLGTKASLQISQERSNKLKCQSFRFPDFLPLCRKCWRIGAKNA
jgi:hypothetical protein